MHKITDSIDLFAQMEHVGNNQKYLSEEINMNTIIKKARDAKYIGVLLRQFIVSKDNKRQT